MDASAPPHDLESLGPWLEGCTSARALLPLLQHPHPHVRRLAHQRAEGRLIPASHLERLLSIAGGEEEETMALASNPRLTAAQVGRLQQWAQEQLLNPLESTRFLQDHAPLGVLAALRSGGHSLPDSFLAPLWRAVRQGKGLSRGSRLQQAWFLLLLWPRLSSAQARLLWRLLGAYPAPTELLLAHPDVPLALVREAARVHRGESWLAPALARHPRAHTDPVVRSHLREVPSETNCRFLLPGASAEEYVALLVGYTRMHSRPPRLLVTQREPTPEEFARATEALVAIHPQEGLQFLLALGTPERASLLRCEALLPLFQLEDTERRLEAHRLWGRLSPPASPADSLPPGSSGRERHGTRNTDLVFRG